MESTSLNVRHEAGDDPDALRGVIYDIKRYAIHDGPGIRSTVFFKGCPLRCDWCQNPEGQDPLPQLLLLEGRCLRCGACAGVCSVEEGPILFDSADAQRTLCVRCGSCADACPSGARTMGGRSVSLSELAGELEKDRIFYDESCGGVTFSGGEPLRQADFLRACLQTCKEREYHTAVDTCGYAKPYVLLDVATLADLFLYDLKLMDSERHRQHTGVPNDLILSNLETLCLRGHATWVRFPLIPGVNDDQANLDALAEFVGGLEGEPPVHVLPYHRIGSDKYERLGVAYHLGGIRPPTAEQTARVVEWLEASGLSVRIGG